MFKPSRKFLIAAVAPPLHQLLTCETCGCLRLGKNMLLLRGILVTAAGCHSELFLIRGTLSLQLVASATWDLCRFSWSLPLRGTFVASVGCLRYVGR